MFKKLGMIFSVDNKNKDLVTHAANPLPIHLKDNIFRIFYSGRNINNKSSVSYVDVDIIDKKIIDYPLETLFTYGGFNSFYSHGVSIGNIYESPQKNKYILFMGWQIRPNKHWKGEIGRIELFNNNKLILNPQKAFLPLDIEDPISLSYPYVI